MAAEQANFNAVDVDTRADVYALSIHSTSCSLAPRHCREEAVEGGGLTDAQADPRTGGPGASLPR